MQILTEIFWVAIGLAILAGIWKLISRLIERGRKIFFWINFAIACGLEAWILKIHYLGHPSESMVIFVPLTFEFFHICIGLIAALILRYLERLPSRKPTT